jgi:hypothetical protein
LVLYLFAVELKVVAEVVELRAPEVAVVALK